MKFGSVIRAINLKREGLNRPIIVKEDASKENYPSKTKLVDDDKE